MGWYFIPLLFPHTWNNVTLCVHINISHRQILTQLIGKINISEQNIFSCSFNPTNITESLWNKEKLTISYLTHCYLPGHSYSKYPQRSAIPAVAKSVPILLIPEEMSLQYDHVRNSCNQHSTIYVLLIS